MTNMPKTILESKVGMLQGTSTRLPINAPSNPEAIICQSILCGREVLKEKAYQGKYGGKYCSLECCEQDF